MKWSMAIVNSLFIAACAPSLAIAQWVTPAVDAPGVEQHTFESAAAGTTVSYHIYIPLEYATSSCRLPVLYWLHGLGGGVNGIAPLRDLFDNAIAMGQIPPMLVVFPNGLSFSMWSDSVNGNVPMESVVIDELIPEVDSRFRTVASREGRIVEGFSMGGYGAARFGFIHRDLFAGVSILGAASLQLDFLDAPPDSMIPPQLRTFIYAQVWGSDPDFFLEQSPWTITTQNATLIINSGLVVRQAVGQLDSLAPTNLAFQQHMTDLGIPSTFAYPAGIGHSAIPLLVAMGDSNWEFYRSVFEGLCSCPADINTATAGNPDAPGWGVPDGQVTPADFSAFVSFFQSGDLRADLNTATAGNPAAPGWGVPDGVLSPSDFSAFVFFFQQGCP